MFLLLLAPSSPPLRIPPSGANTAKPLTCAAQMSWFRNITSRKQAPAMPDSAPAARPARYVCISEPIAHAQATNQCCSAPHAHAALHAQFDEYERLAADVDKTARLPGLVRNFNAAFAGVSPLDMAEHFRKPQLRPFAGIVARAFVAQVRTRAGSGVPAAAASNLEAYLRLDAAGADLVTALSLLAANAHAIESLCHASLPSTLAKTLYLFLDLPPLPDPSSDLPTRLGALLCKLCEYPAAVEELIASKDLGRLFETMTSVCPPGNIAWRRAACQALSVVASRSLNDNTLVFVAQAQSIQRCVQAVESFAIFGVTEVANMIELVATLVKASSAFSTTLLDELLAANGYRAISSFLFKQESPLLDDAMLGELQRVAASLAKLAYCGVVALTPADQKPGSHAIRNIIPLRELLSLFQQAKTEALCRITLVQLHAVLVADPGNIVVVQHQLAPAGQTAVCLLLDRAIKMSPAILEDTLQVLEFAVFSLGALPCTAAALRLVSHTIVKFINYDAKFADLSREAGFLDVLVAKVIALHDELQEQLTQRDSSTERTSDASTAKDAVAIDDQNYLMMECLALMLSNSSTNILKFRIAGGARALFNIVPLSSTSMRANALRVVQQLMLFM